MFPFLQPLKTNKKEFYTKDLFSEFDPTTQKIINNNRYWKDKQQRDIRIKNSNYVIRFNKINDKITVKYMFKLKK